MKFTAKNIHQYLTNRGYLDSESVINGNYLLTENRSRNTIFQIRHSQNTGLFVKQLNSNDPQNVYLMQKEATALHLIHHSPFFSQIAQYVPKYFGYDPEYNLLVLEFLPAAKNLHETTYEEKNLSVNYARQMAEILASFHFDINQNITENSSLQFFNKQIPWMLNICDLPNIDNQYSTNPIPRFIKQFPEMMYRIDLVRCSWKFTSLIHGDIKWMNFIITDGNIKLIDWEIADIGDPLWDVAGVLQSYLTAWTFSFDNNISTLQQLPGMEFLIPQNTKQAIQEFWNTYVEKQTENISNQKEALEKTMNFTAVRMLQTAFEANNYTQSSEITANSVRLIQLSDNILKNPLEVAQNLFGLNI